MARRAATITAAVLAGALLPGCPDPGQRAEPGPRASDAPASPDAARSRAQAAAQALGARLLDRLQEALSAGPGAGIEVCNAEAAGLTEAVGREHGVRIGRTAQRLRNPANAPPPWAAAHVGASGDAPRFEPLADGGLRALLPIRLQPLCVTCHGPEAQLAPEVRQVLAVRYPDDRATGFAPGDLRGWVWVEVPAP